jgi:two-component sensor histidine kinase
VGAPNGHTEPRRTARHVKIGLPAGPRSSAQVRRAIARIGLPAQLEADAQLLASELVTNGVIHAGLGAEGVLRVTIDWSGRRLLVIVDDGTPKASRRVPVVIRPGPGAEAGWGLYLVDRVADRWGAGARGYWFELRAARSEPVS